MPSPCPSARAIQRLAALRHFHEQLDLEPVRLMGLKGVLGKRD